ncbi:hypothetical protein CIT31_32535 [Mesorhizobium wenxiniae]|uniref:Uncharacterized protein n=1 Tax=Mesorhizobium wenxiniae TaxID=2014805 RepID=A0A271K7A1_9HYPH|nr:hypothetical protein CIT31_32535 [Mesorhizobium wenxiniae]
MPAWTPPPAPETKKVQPQPIAAIEQAAREAAEQHDPLKTDDAVHGDVVNGFSVEPPKKASGDARFAIKYNPNRHQSIAERIEKLLALSPEVKGFLRAGKPMQIGRVADIHDHASYERTGTIELSEPMLYREIEVGFVFFVLKEITEGRGAAKHVVGYEWQQMPRPPKSVAETIIQERVGKWNFRPLAGVLSAPSVKRGTDGRPISVTAPGYDPDTGVYSEFSAAEFVTIGAIPDGVDFAAAQSALHDLRELIAPTPYYDPDDPERIGDTFSHSVGISKIMTTTLRSGFGNAPMHATSGASGAGKSIADGTAIMVANGEPMSPMDWATRADKQELIIDSALISSRNIWSFNNVKQGVKIGNEPDLNTVITEPSKEVRVFYAQGFKGCATGLVTILMNGVGLQIVGEVARRTLFAHIRQRHSGSWYDPRALAKRDRPRFVRACHVITRAYANARAIRKAYEAGEAWATAERLERFGAADAAWTRVAMLRGYEGFGGWVIMVREPIVWLGMPDPCETTFRLRTGNSEVTTVGGALIMIHDVFGDDGFTTGQLIERMQLMTNGGTMAGDSFPPKSVAAHPALIDAILAWVPHENRRSLHHYKQSLGMRLGVLGADRSEMRELEVIRIGETRDKSAIFRVQRRTAGIG